MATSGQYIIVGVFDDLASADKSVMALREAGFSQDQIRHTTSEGVEQSARKNPKTLFSGEKPTSRKDIMNDLVNMGVEPEDARVYQRECEKGHPLVSVIGRTNKQEAITILRDQGGYTPAEIAKKGTDYRTTARSTSRADAQAGKSDVTTTNAMGERTADIAGSRTGEVSPSETNATGERTADIAGSRTGEVSPSEKTESQKMRLHAERLKASTQPEQIGEVDVHKEIITEQQTLNVPVTREEVVVERRSLAEDAAAAEEPIGEGETIRIPISEERVNITKESFATGEVEISKRKVRENRQFSETVRHEESRLENQGDIPIIDIDRNQPPAQPQV